MVTTNELSERLTKIESTTDLRLELIREIQTDVRWIRKTLQSDDGENPGLLKRMDRAERSIVSGRAWVLVWRGALVAAVAAVVVKAVWNGVR